MSGNDTDNSNDSNDETETPRIKQYVSQGVRDVDDTARIATGFVMGGVTAAELGVGSFIIIIMGGLMVLAELLYGVTSVMIEARRLSKRKNSE
jgi:hypothetical protein